MSRSPLFLPTVDLRCKPRRGCWALFAAALFAAAVGPTVAQPPEDALSAEEDGRSAQGFLIRVTLPITGNLDDRVIGIVQRVLRQINDGGGEGPRPVMVFELNPGKTAFGEGNDFTRALKLADYLSSLKIRGLKTVAYLPQSIKGHAVLVAMACEEIVMAPDAELGEAGIDEADDGAIAPAIRSAYVEIANRRRTIPTEVALGMLDKDLEVLKVETEKFLLFAFPEDLERHRETQTVLSQETLIPRGELGRFSGREARELGFVKYLAGDREAVTRALELPPGTLRDDPSLTGDWRPVQLELQGPIGPRNVSQLQSMVDDQLRTGEVNLVCLRIGSPGGSLEDSVVLANYLADLDSAAVLTVAYVPAEARADAALVALACDHLIMHPQAILGGPGPVPIGEEELAAATDTIRQSLAVKKSRNWSLLAATIDPNLEVFEYRHKKTGMVRYLSAAELEELEDASPWQQGERVTQADDPLEIDGERAKQLGLAWELAESFEALKQLYGLQGDPRWVEPSWADFLVEALASDLAATLLVILGGVALYAELQAPGIGIGGFVASVAFLLFFWSKALYGTAGWLEATLFLGGVCFLLLEIFVLPGFGIFGLGGGLMIVSSLVLASQTFVFPSDDRELVQLTHSLLVVGVAAVGIVVAISLFQRFLPHAPMLNQVVLNPLDGEALVELSRRESVVDFQHLVGQTGTTTTQLTPSGKALFGDELVDVIADGEVIDRDCRIVAVEVHGNRVLVQSADRSADA